jgi:hypothetical protein
MPTDVMLVLERRLAAERAADAGQRVGVLMLPLLMGVLTILLAAQSHAVACAVIELGLE